MAQKAAKALAARNASTLNRTLLITLIVNVFFILFRAIIFQSSFTSKSLLRYSLLSSPSWLVQFWFERIGRPRYYPNGELKQCGEDLQAKGLTDWMWDVLYWTYGCVIFAAIVGDYAWWFWAIIPLYSAWLAYSTFLTAKSGMAGLSGSGETDGLTASKRQQKLDKRSGQRIQYR